MCMVSLRLTCVYLFVFSCSEVDSMTVKINVHGEPTIDVCVFVCFQLQ